jgi:serine/threonine protein kinase
MAPEQLTGDDCIDARADVFALAAMIYRLISGRYPYAGQTMVDYARSLLMGPAPQRLDAIDDRVSHELGEVIEKALAIDPQERFSDARTFGGALSEATAASRERRETLLMPTPVPASSSSAALMGQIDTVILRPQQLVTAPMAAIAPPPPSCHPVYPRGRFPTPMPTPMPPPRKMSWHPAAIAIAVSLLALVGCVGVLAH